MEDRLGQSVKLGVVTPIIPAVGRCTEEDQLKVSQGYLEACLGFRRHCVKKTNNQTKKASCKVFQIVVKEISTHQP